MNNFFENLKIHSGYVCAEKQPLESKKKGFTLQETLIALTILGVVAAITIPALINKYIEATNRVKVKKAMAAYEKALNNMVVENGISGSIKSWADEVANCGNTNKYFKIINGGDCRFQTSDKVWWDISDIEHPIISINGEIDDDTVANGKDVFQMVGEFDGSVLRVNDLADSQLSADEKANLEKLYAAMNGNQVSTNTTDYAAELEKYNNGDFNSSCYDGDHGTDGNYYGCTLDEDGQSVIYDSSGNYLFKINYSRDSEYGMEIITDLTCSVGEGYENNGFCASSVDSGETCFYNPVYLGQICGQPR